MCGGFFLEVAKKLTRFKHLDFYSYSIKIKLLLMVNLFNVTEPRSTSRGQ